MTNEVLEAFHDEAEALDRVVEKLSADDVRRPTNCPPWDVKELIVHIAMVLPPYSLREADASTPDITEPALDREDRAALGVLADRWPLLS